jgi:LAS superfamily LD-carboxypeptidase LdcB
MMALSVRTVEYFYTKVENEASIAYELLATLASEDINLLAFSAVPFGANHVELTIFPDQTANFLRLAAKFGWSVTGPQHAVLIQGDDHLGALAEIQKTLLAAGISIYASSGITSADRHFGYVIYLREGDHLAAAKALSA